MSKSYRSLVLILIIIFAVTAPVFAFQKRATLTQTYEENGSQGFITFDYPAEWTVEGNLEDGFLLGNSLMSLDSIDEIQPGDTQLAMLVMPPSVTAEFSSSDSLAQTFMDIVMDMLTDTDDALDFSDTEQTTINAETAVYVQGYSDTAQLILLVIEQNGGLIVMMGIGDQSTIDEDLFFDIAETIDYRGDLSRST